MKIYHLLIYSFLLLAVACNSVPEKVSSSQQPTVTVAVDPVEGSPIIQLDERLAATDSMVFLFYKDPHGKDSLRYTRYYTQHSSTDTSVIQFVLQGLNDSTERFEKIKKCHSEGKIWCFRKGEIFQTIYFSAHNKDCSFVYIIKNGQFYYSDISKNLSAKLVELKPLALESSNEGE